MNNGETPADLRTSISTSNRAPIPPSKPQGRLLGGAMRICRSRLGMVYGEPLSKLWGWDRGQPAHRHYIELFLHDHADDIKGRCLEFQDPIYLTLCGTEKITHVDILHIDESNPNATVVADITKPNDIPADSYDCIICTHVLHLIYEFEAAVQGMWRILKHSGVLLIASPQNSMCDEEQNEYWRFTRLGLQTMLARVFGEKNVQAKAYGNSIVSAGELRGLTAEDFTRKELYTHDVSTASEICARAVK